VNRARAVVFDFDGVIAASEPFHYRAVCETIAPLGIHVSWDRYREKYLHFGDREVLNAVLTDHEKNPSQQDLDVLLSQKHDRFGHFRDEGMITLCDGFLELLLGLVAAGVPIGLCSSGTSHDILSVLNHHGIRPHFRCVVTIEDVPRGKPDPTGYLMAVEQLAQHVSGVLPAGDVVAVEDSPGGLAAANAAGLRTLGVCTSYSPEALKTALVVYPTLAGLTPDKLLSIRGRDG